MRKYPKLGVIEFGQHLLDSGDLDPLYIALDRLKLDPVTRNRWLLVYWCCYDAGVSSYIANAGTVGEFWSRMRTMAENVEPSPIGGRWKRGHERRHWRGKNAGLSLDYLIKRYREYPEDMAAYCSQGVPTAQIQFATQTTCATIMKRAREHVAFGPWIGFKIADMAERCMDVAVSFEQAEVFLFDAPREGALNVWVDLEGRHDEANEPARIATVIKYLTAQFAGRKAPPRGDRPIGIQEVETILCKWKSHCNGHYPLFNDQREIRAGLVPWAECDSLARRFLEAMPKEAA